MKHFVFSILLVVLATGAAATQSPAAAPATEIERLKKELIEVNEQLRLARAQRADCEVVLGPLEARVRGDATQKDLARLKAEMEQARGGSDKVECDPLTLTCVKKAPVKEEPTPKPKGPGV